MGIGTAGGGNGEMRLRGAEVFGRFARIVVTGATPSGFVVNRPGAAASPADAPLGSSLT